MNENLLEEINHNLEVIVGLLVRAVPGADTANLRERVLMLDSLGMRPKDIARVLGKTPKHISKELSLGRSASKRAE